MEKCDFMNDCIDTEDYNCIVEYEDDELKNWDPAGRRPYYRLVGKPVTEDQALEIIARTDRFWETCASDELLAKVEDQLVSTFAPMNAYWFYNLLPCQHGFVKPNGNIYTEGITGKYPDTDELLWDLTNLATAFPFLDFVMAVTEWNELPHEVWQMDWRKEQKDPWLIPEAYSSFKDDISIAFHVCGGKVKVLTRKSGRALYTKYEQLYLDENDFTFYTDYAFDNGILVCDENYMEKMFGYFGISKEEMEPYLKKTKELYLSR